MPRLPYVSLRTDYKIITFQTTILNHFGAFALITMGLLDWTMHLLNFVAPALALALVLPLGARLLVSKAASAQSWLAQIAIDFIAGVAVLLGGLWWWGRDGKMATYCALVVVMASCQWALSRSWRR
jgi:branched-subunit amino acid transport protein